MKYEYLKSLPHFLSYLIPETPLNFFVPDPMLALGLARLVPEAARLFLALHNNSHITVHFHNSVFVRLFEKNNLTNN